MTPTPSGVPCPRDTDGDGNCGAPACPFCGPQATPTTAAHALAGPPPAAIDIDPADIVPPPTSPPPEPTTSDDVIIAALNLRGPHGATVTELASALVLGMPDVTVRLAVLHREGYVAPVTVWVLTEEGQQRAD